MKMATAIMAYYFMWLTALFAITNVILGSYWPALVLFATSGVCYVFGNMFSKEHVTQFENYKDNEETND